MQSACAKVALIVFLFSLEISISVTIAPISLSNSRPASTYREAPSLAAAVGINAILLFCKFSLIRVPTMQKREHKNKFIIHISFFGNLMSFSGRSD